MTMRNKLTVSHVTLPGWEIAQDLPSIPFSRASCKGFAEPYVSPVISMLYPCYIHVISICGQKQTAHPFLFPNVFPFSSHLKGAKAQIKIRRFKVETRRRRDVMQPVVIRSSTGTWTCLLLGHLWQCKTIRGASGFIEDMLKVILGTNWRQQAREFSFTWFWYKPGPCHTGDGGTYVRLDSNIFSHVPNVPQMTQT